MACCKKLRNILKTEGAYVLTGNTLEEGSLQIVYDVNPNQYCLTFNIGGVDIVANTNSANGIIPNYCNYSFITNDNQIILTLNNIQQSLTVNGSTVSWGSDTCTTTINVSFNSSTNYGIILYVIQGTLDNYVDMKQIYLNSSTTLNLQLVKNQYYSFLVSKPMDWELSINDENINRETYQFYVPFTDVNPTSFLLEISNELTDSNKNNEIIL